MTRRPAGRAILKTSVAAFLVAVVLFTGITPVHVSHAGGPTTFTVNSAADGGDLSLGDGECCASMFCATCTLRAAIEELNALASPSEVVINIQPLHIQPASDLDPIDGNVYIHGAGSDLTVVDYQETILSHVLDIDPGHSVRLEGLTLQGGQGGLEIAGGQVDLTDVTIADNAANGSGGGIANHGELTMHLSRITNNTTPYDGGGISNSPGAIASIYDSTISGNGAPSGEGGGLFAAAGSTLRLDRSTLSGNSAMHGGGLMLEGSATLINTTLSGNSASELVTYAGTAIYFHAASASEELWLGNSTLAGNTGRDAFAHVGAAGSMAWIYNSIFADNQSANCAIVRGYGEAYDFDDDGSCFFGDTGGVGDALLLPLGNYGGPTQTRRPAPGSPVIDAGHPTGCTLDAVPILTDQRGWPRPLDGDHNGTARCDMGAVETGWDVFLPLILRSWP